MVRRPSRCLGIDTDEPELRQIQLVDEDVDHANRIILANPIFQAFRKERALSAIRAFNEALHQIPPRIRAGIITRESLLSERFYTAWYFGVHSAPPPCRGHTIASHKMKRGERGAICVPINCRKAP